jgi:glycosyltransferase involved in cell wall biosynthesis
MEIGIETSALSTKYTGTSRYIRCIIEQLNATGHKPASFSPTERIGGNVFANRLLKLSKGGIQRHLYRDFFLSGDMKKVKTDCGIFPNYFMPVQFQKPSIIIIHDLSFITHPQFYSKPFVVYYTKRMKKTLANNPIIVTVSENSKEQIHRYLGINKENIFLIQAYSKFKRSLGNSSGSQNKRPYFLYVGHVEPRKNLQFLIENFLSWKEERRIDISLTIAGEIWIKSSSVKMLLIKYKNHPDIKFTGYVEEEILHKLYSNASGFVHTSFVEGFGFPVLEAMQYNLPIVCSRGTATEEISSPGSVLIDPYSDKSLEKGLDRIYSMYLSKEDANYTIRYSPELMSNQLNTVLDKVKDNLNGHFTNYPQNTEDTKEAVEKTLLYASLFHSGIRRDNLLKSIFNIKTSEKVLESALSNLIIDKAVSIRDNTVYLNSYKKAFYNKDRQNKQLKKSLLFLKFLKAFPLISVISFSGGTAHYGINHHDDIDLFIITKPNCVYPVYAVVHLFSVIFGLRKVICANYLIDENNLEINSPRDFYTAHQVISLVPYKNMQGLNNFFSRNNWINKFFPNFEYGDCNIKPAFKFFKIFIPFNILIMSFYKRLYSDKILRDRTESLKLGRNYLKLHTNDHRTRITLLFENEWKLYLEKKSEYNTKIITTENSGHRETASAGIMLKENKTKIKFSV